jgi:hypothetical protein
VFSEHPFELSWWLRTKTSEEGAGPAAFGVADVGDPVGGQELVFAIVLKEGGEDIEVSWIRVMLVG